MAWYIRKGINFGPIRLNLSKGGLGVSVGVKGLRVGKGPRGAYVHAGREGLYYRKQLHINENPTREEVEQAEAQESVMRQNPPEPVTESAEEVFESLFYGFGCWMFFILAASFFILAITSVVTFTGGLFQVVFVVSLLGLGFLFLLLGRACVHLDEKLKERKNSG